jgi:fermentation-respiration switch protein FrsA (DUF1100 family)
MAHQVLPGAGALMKTRWDSLSKIPRVRAPLLVLHGDADEVVPIAQGRELFAAARTSKVFVGVKGARHNDVSEAREYWEGWKGFLSGR